MSLRGVSIPGRHVLYSASTAQAIATSIQESGSVGKHRLRPGLAARWYGPAGRSLDIGSLTGDLVEAPAVYARRPSRPDVMQIS
jgi:hypothetical protein